MAGFIKTRYSRCSICKRLYEEFKEAANCCESVQAVEGFTCLECGTFFDIPSVKYGPQGEMSKVTCPGCGTSWSAHDE